MTRLLKIISIAAFLTLSYGAAAQYPACLHSHNDYRHTAPFYQAYGEHFHSIECDMFYVDGKFLVGHDVEDLTPERSFDALYFRPILYLYRCNGGRAWKDSDEILQLVCEIKSNNTDAYLKALAKKLAKYPEVFDPGVNPYAVRVCITGNVPAPADFSKYPAYFLYDGDLEEEYSEGQLAQVSMFSMNFGKFSEWNGKGTLKRDEEKAVKDVIAKVHSMGKPIRFWGCPDGVTAWNTFYHFGVDIINTDDIRGCSMFFSDWKNKNYVIGGDAGAAESGVTRTDRLDRTTRNFSGFRNDKLCLSEPIDTYTPTYCGDGADRPIKNVIYLIGDGMGLAQIAAAYRVNGALSMLSMKSIGLVNNAPLDAFTTCSAAAGSGLATGEITSNRHISCRDDGTPVPSLSDFFAAQGKACGVVTLGNAVDATPAAFYGHNVERDDAADLTKDLLESPISLLAGSGRREFVKRNDGLDLVGALNEKGFSFIENVEGIPAVDGKVICIDERMDEAANVDNIGLLAHTTDIVLSKLEKMGGENGFFVMIEGAKVDYAGHSRCLPGSIVETLSFDLAVAEALRYADTHEGTLVVVTADHETGGLTLIDGDKDTGLLTAYYVTNDHTPILLPVFAYGPHSQEFAGQYLQRDIARKIKRLSNN